MTTARQELKDFVALCNSIAKERGVRWFKNSGDIPNSISNWLNENQGLYWWALDVVELAVIQKEAEKRNPAEGPMQNEARPEDRIVRLEPKEPELDLEITAIEHIAEVLEPLDWPARVRVLKYIRSRFADRARKGH